MLIVFLSEAQVAVALQKGDHGSGVITLQRHLKQLGYYHGELTGYFGAFTESALSQFQKEHNLSITGNLDAGTSAALQMSSVEQKVSNPEAFTSSSPTAFPLEKLSDRPSESPAVPRPATATAPSQTPLQLGSQGAEVRKLQNRLKQLGYYKGAITGNYDRATAEAVQRFQHDRELVEDGISGTATLAALKIPSHAATTALPFALASPSHAAVGSISQPISPPSPSPPPPPSPIRHRLVHSSTPKEHRPLPLPQTQTTQPTATQPIPNQPNSKQAPALQIAKRPLPIPLSAEAKEEQQIKEAIAQLPLKQIGFKVPAEMEVGVEQRIEAVIAKTVTQELLSQLQSPAKPEIENLRIGVFATVELKGDGDKFRIIPLNAGEQVVVGDGSAQWSWDVTPLEAGEQSVYLVASTQITVPGETKPIEKRYPVYTKKVTVKVNPVYSTTEFVRSSWKELLGVIVGSGSLMGLIGWLIERRRREEERGASANPKS